VGRGTPEVAAQVQACPAVYAVLGQQAAPSELARAVVVVRLAAAGGRAVGMLLSFWPEDLSNGSGAAKNVRRAWPSNTSASSCGSCARAEPGPPTRTRPAERGGAGSASRPGGPRRFPRPGR